MFVFWLPKFQVSAMLFTPLHLGVSVKEIVRKLSLIIGIDIPFYSNFILVVC